MIFAIPFRRALRPRLHFHPRRPAFPLAAVILGGNELRVRKAEMTRDFVGGIVAMRNLQDLEAVLVGPALQIGVERLPLR